MALGFFTLLVSNPELVSSVGNGHSLEKREVNRSELIYLVECDSQDEGSGGPSTFQGFEVLHNEPIHPNNDFLDLFARGGFPHAECDLTLIVSSNSPTSKDSTFPNPFLSASFPILANSFSCLGLSSATTDSRVDIL
jgi:hypothetical protein